MVGSYPLAAWLADRVNISDPNYSSSLGSDFETQSLIMSGDSLHDRLEPGMCGLAGEASLACDRRSCLTLSSRTRL